MFSEGPINIECLSLSMVTVSLFVSQPPKDQGPNITLQVRFQQIKLE